MAELTTPPSATEEVVIEDDTAAGEDELESGSADQVDDDNDELETSTRPKNNDRKFKTSWKETFPWVLYENRRMCCKVCREAATRKFKVTAKNTFAYSGSTGFKISALQRHARGDTKVNKKRSMEHSRLVAVLKLYPQRATQSGAQKQPIQAVVAKAQIMFSIRRQAAMDTLFHTMYHLAVKERPLSSYADEVK